MSPPSLPSPTLEPAPGLAGRAQAFLTRTWRGQVLLGALAVYVLEKSGAPLPGVITVPARLVLCGYVAVGLFRVASFMARRLLWKIRTKLIVSYLFIAVVPIALLALFVFIGGLFSMVLVASHMVASEIDHTAQELRLTARTALAGLVVTDSRLTSLVDERLAPAREVHPGLVYTLVQDGKSGARPSSEGAPRSILASSGNAPRELPAWYDGTGFAGLVRAAAPAPDVATKIAAEAAVPAKAAERLLLRAVWSKGDLHLIVDAPLDASLFAELERRTSIRVQTPGFRLKTVRKGERGIHIELDDPDPAPAPGESASLSSGRELGWQSFAVVDRTDWPTGKLELGTLGIKFQPTALIRRLSPASKDMGDVLLVRGLTVVGAAFLVIYVIALGLGLLLARSITRSVHALSLGTERLRQGDFAHPIQVQSRDQLGELAESFNMMTRGIQDLLREQAEKERLEEELRIARTIQMSLLPQGSLDFTGIRIAALCLPAAEVGGDYYDLLPLSEARLGVLVADVSGKGTSAALYMAELKGLVLSLSRIYESPAKLLGEANRILAANMDSRSFITMTYAVVDTAARTMRFARAGHNPIIHLDAASGQTRVLAPQGLGLGIDRGDRFEEILEEAEVPLRSGDVFLFFTDGLSEAMNGQSELFGEGRLRKIIEDIAAAGGEGEVGATKERILAEIRTFVGEAAQHDDMTLVLLKVV